jgi:hypothetical protein
MKPALRRLRVTIAALLLLGLAARAWAQAGPANQAGVDTSDADPTKPVLFSLTWIILDSEVKVDWEAGGRTSLKTGFQLGRSFGRLLGLTIKPEIPWGGIREGDWTVKLFLLYVH